MPNVTEPSRPTSGVSHEPPVPSLLVASANDRVDFPDQLAGACVECQQYPAAGSSSDGACQVDTAICHLWLDAEQALSAAEQIPVDPYGLASSGIQREDRGRGVPVHDTTRDRDTIRPALGYRRADLGPDVTSEPGSLNVHAGCKLATLAEEIAEPAASRVFARSPFGYGHDPAGFAALGFRTVVAVGVALPHAAASALIAMRNAAAR